MVALLSFPACSLRYRIGLYLLEWESYFLQKDRKSSPQVHQGFFYLDFQTVPVEQTASWWGGKLLLGIGPWIWGGQLLPGGLSVLLCSWSRGNHWVQREFLGVCLGTGCKPHCFQFLLCLLQSYLWRHVTTSWLSNTNGFSIARALKLWEQFYSGSVY